MSDERQPRKLPGATIERAYGRASGKWLACFAGVTASADSQADALEALGVLVAGMISAHMAGVDVGVARDGSVYVVRPHFSESTGETFWRSEADHAAYSYGDPTLAEGHLEKFLAEHGGERIRFKA